MLCHFNITKIKVFLSTLGANMTDQTKKKKGRITWLTKTLAFEDPCH